MNELDHRLFLWLNSFHNSYFDAMMLFVSRKQSWYLLYLMIVLLILKEDCKKGIKKIIGIIVAVTLSDQFCSSLLKPFFKRLRPCYDPDLQGLIHQVGDCGGQFGFASSHAANSFALVVMLILFYRQKSPWMYFGLIWATLIAYSRIYLGVHFPADVLVGALVGTLFSASIFNIYRKKSF